MKTILIGFIFAMVVIASQALVVRPGPIRPGRPSFPTFPGQGPFNPRIPNFPRSYRFRRSPDAGGNVTATVIQPLDGPERRPSVSLNYDHKIYEGTYGDVSVTGGAQKNPGHNVEGKVGIQGTIRLGSPSRPSRPSRPSYYPPTAWDIDENGREKVIP